MAAARNYIFTLNAEVASTGVYAGTINIGAFIDRSTGLERCPPVVRRLTHVYRLSTLMLLRMKSGLS
jgi:hypothetical protein